MKTVKIKPAVAYANGQRMEATQINVVSKDDDLFSRVVFKYTLYTEAGVWAGEAVLNCEYTSVDTNSTLLEVAGSNIKAEWDATAEGAYAIVCAAIGAELADEAVKVTFLGV